MIFSFDKAVGEGQCEGINRSAHFFQLPLVSSPLAALDREEWEPWQLMGHQITCCLNEIYQCIEIWLVFQKPLFPTKIPTMGRYCSCWTVAKWDSSRGNQHTQQAKQTEESWWHHRALDQAAPEATTWFIHYLLKSSMVKNSGIASHHTDCRIQYFLWYLNLFYFFFWSTTS